MILNLPPVVAEAEANSENGPSKLLVGGVGFSWSEFIPNIFFITKSSYQSSNSLSSLPSKNIASCEIVNDQFWTGIVHFLAAF